MRGGVIGLLALGLALPARATPVPIAAQLDRVAVLMLRDPPAAARAAEAARADAARAGNPALLALCEHRLALVRALGGDRAAQVAPMAAAAFRLRDAAATPTERSRAAQALIVAASFAMTTGDAALTERTRDAALALLTRDDLAHDAGYAEALRVAGDVYVFQNRPEEALRWGDRAVAAYEALGGSDPGIVFAYARRGWSLLRLSRGAEALVALRRAVALADASDGSDPTVAPLALRALGSHYMRLGETALALPLLERALVAAEALPPGFPYAGGLTRDIMHALLASGRWAEARVYAERTAARARETLGPRSYEYASALLVLARIDTRLGALEAASARIDQAEAIMARALVTGSSRAWEPLAARAAVLVARGDGASAAALYARADAVVAALPDDDPDRIDLAADGADALLAGGKATEESWHLARRAADALTARTVRQAAMQGASAADAGNAARIYGTALDVAWARRTGRPGAPR